MRPKYCWIFSSWCYNYVHEMITTTHKEEIGAQRIPDIDYTCYLDFAQRNAARSELNSYSNSLINCWSNTFQVANFNIYLSLSFISRADSSAVKARRAAVLHVARINPLHIPSLHKKCATEYSLNTCPIYFIFADLRTRNRVGCVII